jgi:hypothetical protein
MNAYLMPVIILLKPTAHLTLYLRFVVLRALNLDLLARLRISLSSLKSAGFVSFLSALTISLAI